MLTMTFKKMCYSYLISYFNNNETIIFHLKKERKGIYYSNHMQNSQECFCMLISEYDIEKIQRERDNYSTNLLIFIIQWLKPVLRC